MTDTPDALILSLVEAVRGDAAEWEHGGGSKKSKAEVAAADKALRARLTAGDAAIERVAALTKDERDYLDTFHAIGVALGWPAKTDGVPDTAWDDKPKFSVAVAKVVADLAAARAEIERKDAALLDARKELSDWHKSIQGDDAEKYDVESLIRAIEKIDAALAHKETNNG